MKTAQVASGLLYTARTLRGGAKRDGVLVARHKLLMVDDDAILLQFIEEYLESKGFDVDTVRSGSEALEKIKSCPRDYSLVILDYQMEGQDGAETTELLLKINPQLFILIYSGDTTRDAVLLSTRNGARGFVDKGEGKEVFLAEVEKMCKRYETEVVTVSDRATNGDKEKAIKSIGMVGSSDALAEIAHTVSKLKNKNGPVLILGESGAGKELVARALHGNRKGPFRAVNCADFLMSKGTARSELFGHSRGAFTGADRDKLGVFEEAQDGTVFLDEVYCLPPEAQVGLLRALQEKVVTRIGSNAEIKIRCRIIAAAKPDLALDVSREHFKSDLYYRISQNVIEIPALRDRKEDIAPLVNHFCKKWSEENGEKKEFLALTIPNLERYSWPGNARELENVVYSVLNTSAKSIIAPEDLGAKFKIQAPLDLRGSVYPLRSLIESVEKEHILEVAAKCRSLRETAAKLQISPQALLRLFEKHKIDSRKAIGGSQDGGIKQVLE